MIDACKTLHIYSRVSREPSRLSDVHFTPLSREFRRQGNNDDEGAGIFWFWKSQNKNWTLFCSETEIYKPDFTRVCFSIHPRRDPKFFLVPVS